MLPFLKRKQNSIAGIIIKNRTPDEPSNSNDLEKEYSIEDCAQDLINAIHSHDKAAVATALQKAYEHMEEPKSEDNSFEAQNIKAAKEME